MVSISNKAIDLEEIRKRAVQIRNQWSMSERDRRTGLPPDVPARLRDFILGRKPAWNAAKASGK